MRAKRFRNISCVLVLILVQILIRWFVSDTSSDASSIDSLGIFTRSGRYDLLRTHSIEMNTRHHALAASLISSHLERLAISEPSTAQEETLSFLTELELTRSESETHLSQTDVSSAVRRALNESMARSLQTFMRYLDPDSSEQSNSLNLVQKIVNTQSSVKEKESELDRLYESISLDRECIAELIPDVQSLLSSILTTWPPIVFSAELSTHTNILQKLSALLLKLSLLPLRQRDVLFASHPNLQVAMVTYQAAVLRRTARAQKEMDGLKDELKKYQTVMERNKGELERLARTKAGLDAVRAKVESEVRELRRAVREQ